MIHINTNTHKIQVNTNFKIQRDYRIQTQVIVGIGTNKTFGPKPFSVSAQMYKIMHTCNENISQ